MPRGLALPRLPSNTKPIVSTFPAGRNAMMAPGTPSGTNPDALTINQHTPQEIKLIKNMCRRNPYAGLVVFWVKLRQRGYSRSISGLYRFLKKQGIMAVPPPNPKYIPKPYEKIDYPGFQMDVKFVPSACLKNSNVIGKQFFQYTAIDEYSHWRFVEAFEEHNTYCSAQFVERPFPVPLNVSRQIMAQNLQNALLPTGKSLPFSKNIWKYMGFATKLSGPSHLGTTAR